MGRDARSADGECGEWVCHALRPQGIMNYQITLNGKDVALATEVGVRRNQSNIYWGSKSKKASAGRTRTSTLPDLPVR